MYNDNITFCNDKLDRKKCLRKINDNIKILNYNKSVSIAVNGAWGTGKTYFIKMWEDIINNSELYVIPQCNDSEISIISENYINDRAIYYNAWENDDCESALLPLFYNIISTVDKDTNDFLEIFKIFLKIASIGAISFLPNKILNNGNNIINFIKQSIDDISGNEIEQIFNDYNAYFEKRKTLRKCLEKVIPDSGNLWIFIDDLDRCSPEFAIRTLECTKHFFDLPNIIFVYAVDIINLDKVVSLKYGTQIKSNAYFRKFFDIIYQIPSVDIDRYMLLSQEEYFFLSNDNIIIENSSLLKFIQLFDCNIRDINSIFDHIIFFLEHNKERIESFKLKNNEETTQKNIRIFMFFLICKNMDSKLYYKLLKGEYRVKEKKKTDYELIESKYYKADSDIEKILNEIAEGKGNIYADEIIERCNLFMSEKNKTFEEYIDNIIG